MKPILRSFTADNDEILAVIKTNCFLAIAISLGLRIDGRDLYAPNNEYVVFPFLSLHRPTYSGSNAFGTAVYLFHQQLQISIGELDTEPSNQRKPLFGILIKKTTIPAWYSD